MPVSRRSFFGIAAGAVAVAAAVPAAAADKPVLDLRGTSGVTFSSNAQIRAAIADQERRRRMTPKQFEGVLSSPIGKGRLE